MFTAVQVPRQIDLSSTTATLNTSIDENTQLNYCKFSRVEFRCVDEKGIVVSKIEPKLIFELPGLQPFTEYQCSARIENCAGFSNYSDTISLTTKEGSKFVI